MEIFVKMLDKYGRDTIPRDLNCTLTQNQTQRIGHLYSQCEYL